MGRTSDDEGETSTKTCKSDDIDDRPLKKARYVWQIKGKYHLKKPEEDKSTLFISKSNAKEDCPAVSVKHCSHVGCDINSCNCEFKVMESDEDCIKNVDIKMSDDHRTFPDNSLTVTNNVSANQKLPHMATSKPDVPRKCNQSSKMLRSGRVSSMWQLRKWQARQVARCFVDNTINRVLEDMGFVPLPVDADDILDEEFPMTESENDEGLEDEAVLMAIHSHGLQRTEGPGTGSVLENAESDVKVELKPVNSYGKESGRPAAMIACACSLSQRVADTGTMENLDPFHQRPIFWDRIELDTERYQELENMSHQSMEEFKSSGNVSKWCNSGLFSSVISSDSSCDSDMKSCEENFVEMKQDPILEQTDGTLTVENIEEVVMNEPRILLSESVSNDLQLEDKIEEKSSSSFEHNDFLDKAVAVAIQKKGLSTLSCTDYG